MSKTEKPKSPALFRRKRLTKVERHLISEIQELWAKGSSLEQIAEDLGLTAVQVADVVNRYGNDSNPEAPAEQKPGPWRDIVRVHPAADLFPMMTPAELAELGADIQKRGMIVPILFWVDKDGQEFLLDGRNRLEAMERVGKPWVDAGGDTCVPIHKFDSDTDPYEQVLSLNLHRRHLTSEQKREIITKVLKAQPGKSNRTIAKQTKVDHKTVGAVREKLEGRGEIPHVDAVEDTRGRQQPTKKKRRTADDFVGDMKAKQVDLEEAIAATPEPSRAVAEKKAKQQAKAEHRANREAELAAKITALPTKKYGVIYADPPWQFEPWSRDSGMDRAADNHYPTLAYPQIRALDVGSIAAANCVLFLWVTVPMAAYGHRLLDDWGFEYRSQLIWNKDKIGTGYWNRNKHEILLIGTRGNVPAPTPGTQAPSVIDEPVTKHSAKPERFAALIEHYFPTLPRIELFCRGSARPGWDAWGNEALPPWLTDDENSASMAAE